MSDYISREAAYSVLTEYYHHSTPIQNEALKEALSRVPDADCKQRPLSNADRIRAMTDEELARILMNYSCSLCPIKNCGGRVEVGVQPCMEYWFDWLRKEVDHALS